MKIEDPVGSFTIIGTNQDEASITYKGTLKLTLDNDNRIIANWLIG